MCYAGIGRAYVLYREQTGVGVIPGADGRMCYAGIRQAYVLCRDQAGLAA